jgi:DNA polymerase-4
VGVANNRLLAKLGSEDAKPDGMTIMPEGREEIIAFLAPRALKDLWGVGKKTSELLSGFGFHTCADVQQCEVQALERVLGSRMARQIREYAFGIASDEVVYERPDAKSISREHTFAEDTSERGDVRQVLLGLVDEVGMQLREVTRYAKVARVRIRDSEFSTATKQHQFASPARDDISLREMALRLFDEMWPNGVAKTIRLVGFGVDNLANDRRPDQGDFFAGVDVRDELLAKRERLSETIDRLRSKGYRV